MASLYDQMDVMSQNSTAMGQAYDAAKNDDSFYIPPEVFDNPDFKRGLKMFLSPDGHAARFIISHEGDPATPEGISHVDPIKRRRRKRSRERHWRVPRSGSAAPPRSTRTCATGPSTT